MVKGRTCEQLRTELRKTGRKVTGTKYELERRLEEVLVTKRSRQPAGAEINLHRLCYRCACAFFKVLRYAGEALRPSQHQSRIRWPFALHAGRLPCMPLFKRKSMLHGFSLKESRCLAFVLSMPPPKERRMRHCGTSAIYINKLTNRTIGRLCLIKAYIRKQFSFTLYYSYKLVIYIGMIK